MLSFMTGQTRSMAASFISPTGEQGAYKANNSSRIHEFNYAQTLSAAMLLDGYFWLTLSLLQVASSASTIPPADFQWPSQYVQSGESKLRVLVQGNGPTFVIIPSYGRDGGDDFDNNAESLVDTGFLVLRPQPRGMLGSVGPMQNVTLNNLAEDVANVIDTLGGGKAIVMGHAFGMFVTKNAAALYPEKIPAIVVASPGGYELPQHIAEQPFIAGNTSFPTSERLAALKLAFFGPNHNASIWLSGWNTATLIMEHGAIDAFGDLTRI